MVIKLGQLCHHFISVEKMEVMGPGQNLLTQVGSGQVSHTCFGFGVGKFPLKISNFSIFFPSGQK